MKTALVVSGGGSKGAFAVGAIEVLLESGITFDAVAGTSTGALIAPLVAINDIETLVHIYTNVHTKDVLRSNWRRLWCDGIKDMKPLENLIRRYMLEDKYRDRYDELINSSCNVFLCSVSLQTKKLMYWSQSCCNELATRWTDKEEFVKCVLSSCVQPFYIRPTVVRGEQLVDGGIRDTYPVDAVTGLGCDRLIVVGNQPEFEPDKDKKDYKWIWQVGFRGVDIALTEVILNDTQFLENRFSGEVIVIRPESSLTDLSGLSGLEFSPDGMNKMRAAGRRRARKVLDS